VWEESCDGLVLVMAMYSAQNVPPCSGVLSVDIWYGGAALRDIPLVLLVTSVAKRHEFLGSNPDFFGMFRPEIAQNPTLHISLSRHRHTQDSQTRPIQAQAHPRHNDTAYPGTDTPKTQRHGLSRHRHTQDTTTRPFQAQTHPRHRTLTLTLALRHRHNQDTPTSLGPQMPR
jgi:hypothetical protein